MAKTKACHRSAFWTVRHVASRSWFKAYRVLQRSACSLHCLEVGFRKIYHFRDEYKLRNQVIINLTEISRSPLYGGVSDSHK